MSDEVTTLAPASMHPDYLTPEVAALEKHSTGSVGLNAAQNVLRTLYATYNDITEAETFVRLDGAHNGPEASKTPRLFGGASPMNGQLAEELKRTTDAAYNRASATVQRELARLESAEKAIQNKVNAMLNPDVNKSAQGIAISGEIRAAIKALPENKRSEAVLALVEEGDVRSVAAILAAPGFVSGLSTSMQELLRLNASEKLFPEEHAALMALRSVNNKVGSAWWRFVEKTTDIQKIENGTRAKARQALSKLAGGK